MNKLRVKANLCINDTIVDGYIWAIPTSNDVKRFHTESKLILLLECSPLALNTNGWQYEINFDEYERHSDDFNKWPIE